jgi:hypothetical protein
MQVTWEEKGTYKILVRKSYGKAVIWENNSKGEN